MKLKEITFIFENLDMITIDGKYIGEFLVEDIQTSFFRVACNAIDKMDIANTVVVEIHKDANKPRYQLGIKEYEQLTFDRFAGGDIVAIDFELTETNSGDDETFNGGCYSYYTKWIGESDYVNQAQKYYVSNCGNLYVVISDGKNIEDFFRLDAIDDSEYMDRICSIYEIGDKYNKAE